LEREGARLRAQYEEKIAQAEAMGYAAKEAIVQEGRQQKEKIITQARDESASMLETVRREVESQFQKERQLIATEVRTLAHEMASKILGRDVA
jgi:F0F1-type ATP synthase membrane subunit b/b'